MKEPKMIYVVFKNSVYAYASENCIKLFTTNKELAKKKADEFSKSNNDDTYYYSVVEFPLDKELQN